MQLDSASDAPVYVNISHANVNDITDAKAHIDIQQGVTYVFDKGYCDYNWWYAIEEAGAKFVSRIKSNAAYRLVENTPVEDTERIAAEHIIQLTNTKPRAKAVNHYALKDLRLIRVYRDGKHPMDIVTNDFERSATEIAQLYQQRWQVELFFKWVKQKLKLKRYFGCSENAVRIQVYCALIAYVAMKLLAQTGNRSPRDMLGVHTWLQHGLLVRDDTARAYYHRRKKQREYIKRVQPELPLLWVGV